MGKRGNSGLSIAAMLVLAAMLVRAALPVGWMPMPTDQGIRVMLCSGRGPIELTLPQSERTKHGPGGSQDDLPRDPCPFGASLAKALDLPAPIAGAAIMVPAAPETIHGAVTARLLAWRSLRPPARGPPVPA